MECDLRDQSWNEGTFTGFFFTVCVFIAFLLTLFFPLVVAMSVITEESTDILKKAEVPAVTHAML